MTQSSSFDFHDTIAAIATAPGRGGIGVVRVSGAKSREIAEHVAGANPEPRKAILARFRDAGGKTIDRGLLISFPAGASYTGEPVVEFHGHGGPVVLQSVLRACLAAGARLAEPGEFTKRAFLNGRMDLVQAEAVADLIEASTEEAARCALRSLEGGFSRELESLVEMLVDLRVLSEAAVDFPEEEVDSFDNGVLFKKLKELQIGLENLISRSKRGSLLRSGLHVVLVGRPNVGKSSLMNRLSGAERSIVTSRPGTTRDALKEVVQIEGIPLTLVDTAGLRESSDEVEQLGMERTRRELELADVVLFVMDGSVGETVEDIQIAGNLPRGVPAIRVFNKVDLADRHLQSAPAGLAEFVEVRVSAKTGEGIQLLNDTLLRVAGWESGGESVFLARERHLQAMGKAAHHLKGASGHLSVPELFAEELRLAQMELSCIVGEYSADDLLGEIFSRFCIGK